MEIMNALTAIFDFIWDIFASGAFLIAVCFMLYNWKSVPIITKEDRDKENGDIVIASILLFFGLTLALRFIAGG